MSWDFDGVDDALEYLGTLITGPPCTLVAWFNSDSQTVSQTILSTNNAASTRIRISIAGAVAGDPVRAEHTGASFADTTAGYTAGTWQHAGGVFNTTASRSAFFMGANKGTNTTAGGTINAYNRVNVACTYNVGSRLQFFNGRIAHCALWNVGLADNEMLMLGAARISPLFIRPRNLVFYVPFIREKTDCKEPHISGVTTFSAPAPYADHPRVFMPRRAQIILPKAA